MRHHQVSIIMPCYNAGPFVSTAIESVLKQNVSAQLIAVNDGSTDNTAEVLARFGSDIQVIESDNQGVANARNLAIDHVNSPYVLLLDADDALAPDALAMLLDRAGGDDRVLVYGNFSSWDAGMSRRLHLHRTVGPGRNPLSLLVRRNIAPPGAMLFPTGVFDRVGRFDQVVATCEDWDLVIRMARAGYRFTGLNREVFHYRRLPSSASNQVSRMLASGQEVVRRCHYADLRVTGDLYPGGHDRDRYETNLVYYQASCLGLASLSSVESDITGIINLMRIPAGFDWVEFGRVFRQSVWWNSLAVKDGTQADVIRHATHRCVRRIQALAAGQAWGAGMIMGILTPDFGELLRRPGPKKALRLFREWRLARQIAGQKHEEPAA